MAKGRTMSMERMKAIDHWLGIPLCVCLGALATLIRRLRGRAPSAIPAEPKRVVVMKFFGLGSIVQAGPMLRAIRARHPHSELIFLTFDGNAGLVERMGVCSDVRRIRTNGAGPFVADVIEQVVRFATEPADVCIDLEFFAKFSTLISVFSRAPVRVAFHLNSFWRSSLVTHPVYYNYYRHISDAYNEAASIIGAPVSDLRPCRIAYEPAALERARQQLHAAGWADSHRLVGVNVNAGELSLERRWPAERFAALLEHLSAQPGIQAVLTGAPDEMEYVSSVVAQLSPGAQSKTINIAGKLSFVEFVASMELYDFFITNDSGPLHVAYAQGVNTVSLWGVGRPSFYGPLSGTHTTFYKDLKCSPCLYMFTSQIGQWCEHRGDCMRAIGVDEVWAAVQAYLNTNGADRERVSIAQGW